MHPHHTPKAPVREVSPGESTALGLQFAMDLGVTIALPAVLFGLGGRYADRYFGTAHLFFFLGLLIAFVLSFTIIFRKLKVILSRMPKDLPPTPRKKDSMDPDTAREQEIIHDLFRPPSV